MKKFKPTSPGQRGRIGIDYSAILTANRPHKKLTRKIATHAGRNNRGVITTRHQGAGHKKRYREIDFRQGKLDVPGRVETIEYDPYRTAFIALVVYRDGRRVYILAPRELKVGEEILTAEKAELKTGNRMLLKNIPIGTLIHNVELRKDSGGRLARAAGTYAEILAHDAGYTDIKLSSKAVRKISSNNFASIGQVSNHEYNLVNIGKAGRARWLGIRPTVRGSAMNPVDHPYGGGEGRQRRGTKRPKTLWGKVTGGRKTRRPKKWSNNLIVKGRPRKRQSKK